MSDAIQICSSIGIKVKESASDSQKDIRLLNYLENLLRAKEVLDEAATTITDYVYKKLSADGKNIFLANHQKNPNAPASQKITDTIADRKAKGFKDDDADGRLLKKMLQIALAAENTVERIIKTMPGPIQAKHRDHMSRQNLTDALDKTILVFRTLYEDKFSPALRKIVRRTKSSKAVMRLLRGVCLKHKWVKPRVVKPRIGGPKVVIPPPKPAWYKNLDYSLRWNPAYGYRISGNDDLSILAGEGRGLLAAQGALSVKYKFSKKYSLQLDYSSSTPIEVAGENKDDRVVSNLDLVRLSAIMNPLKSLDVLLQAGWLYYRNDYPSERTEDLNGFVQNLRLNYRPASKLPGLSVNIDESFFAGWANSTFPVESQVTVRALLKAGVSYAVKVKDITIIPYGGGLVGYYMAREQLAYGGYAGASLVAGDHEANLYGVYNNVEGVTANVRYFYNTGRWGVGLRAFYNLYSGALVDTELNTQHTVGGEVSGRVALAKVLGNQVELRPWVRYVHLLKRGSGDKKAEASNILAGIGIWWGKQNSAIPSDLRPDSINTLPEER